MPEVRVGTTVYSELRVRPIINAATSWTVIGGTLMSPQVMDAMREASQQFVDMHELQQRAGEEIARLTSNEAAYVTCGAAAGIALSVLASRTRGETTAIGKLLEGLELPDEVIMHTAHRMPYEHAVRLGGARIRPIGNVLQTFEYELEAAFSPRTAAILYVVGAFVAPGALPLETVVRIAHAHDVPVIVDAAGQLPPVENLWTYTKDSYADMAVFSGGKELRGPQSSGVIVGRHDWIEAVKANGAPHQRLARSMKVGKEEMVGLVAAIRVFMATDHEKEWSALHKRSVELAEHLSTLVGVAATVEDTNAAGARLPRIRIAVDPLAARNTAESVVNALWEGEPRIAIRPGKGGRFYIELNLVTPSEELIVRERLIDELGVA